MKSYVSPLSRLAVVAVALVCARGVVGSVRGAGDVPAAPPDRLPGDTEPVSYDLRIRPVVDAATENYTFGGRVDIVIRALRYTTAVTLNSRDLTVSAVSGLRDTKTGALVPVAGYAYDEPAERLVVTLGKSIIPRRLYRLTVEFRGALRTDFTGFHKYFYDSQDDSRYLSYTPSVSNTKRLVKLLLHTDHLHIHLYVKEDAKHH